MGNAEALNALPKDKIDPLIEILESDPRTRTFKQSTGLFKFALQTVLFESPDFFR